MDNHIEPFDLDSCLVRTEESVTQPQLKYTIDPRLTRLSYSSRNVLHACPRKFQLEKISKLPREPRDSVTLAFGAVVGIGIQSLLAGQSWDSTVFNMMLNWDLPDLFAVEEKIKKGFFEAIFAV